MLTIKKIGGYKHYNIPIISKGKKVYICINIYDEYH